MWIPMKCYMGHKYLMFGSNICSFTSLITEVFLFGRNIWFSHLCQYVLKLYTPVYLYIMLMPIKCWVRVTNILHMIAIFYRHEHIHICEYRYICIPHTVTHIYTHTCTYIYSAENHVCPSTYICTYLHKCIYNLCMYVCVVNNAALLKLHSNLTVNNATCKLNEKLKFTVQC